MPWQPRAAKSNFGFPSGRGGGMRFGVGGPAGASLPSREGFLQGAAPMCRHPASLFALWRGRAGFFWGGHRGGGILLLTLALQRGSAPPWGDVPGVGGCVPPPQGCPSSPACFCFIRSPHLVPAAFPLSLPPFSSLQALIRAGFSPEFPRGHRAFRAGSRIPWFEPTAGGRYPKSRSSEAAVVIPTCLLPSPHCLNELG